jgi:linoleoyl-CoA desaturase
MPGSNASAAVSAPADARPSATFLPKTAFQRELQARVADYFARTGQSTRGNGRMYLKTAVMLGWLSASYLWLVFYAGSTPVALAAAVSLGLAMAGVGFNIQHDGNHGAYHARPAINHIMALTLDLLGGTAYFWHYKHNVAHHGHPNIDGHDDDINIGILGRFSPHQAWYPHHRFQHLYVWLLYALLALEWQLTGEFRNFYTKKAYGQVPVPPPRGVERVIFWVGKVVFFGLAFGIPLALHPVGHVIGLFVVSSATLGMVLAVVFQLAHCTDQAVFRRVTADDRVVPRGWAEHQAESTANFARDNRLLSWYVGGLNMQIEHHLFPRICHIHYRALAPIVEETCRAHGVPYAAQPGFISAVRAHVRWLEHLGRRPT